MRGPGDIFLLQHYKQSHDYYYLCSQITIIDGILQFLFKREKGDSGQGS